MDEDGAMLLKQQNLKREPQTLLVNNTQIWTDDIANTQVHWLVICSINGLGTV